MSGMTVTYRASFRTARRAPVDQDGAPPEQTARAKQDGPAPPCRAARQLALAHWVERRLDDGTFKSHADAARRIGITQGRMTQLMNLLLLAPEIQERVLAGEIPCGERRLRGVASEPAWALQTELLLTDHPHTSYGNLRER